MEKCLKLIFVFFVLSACAQIKETATEQVGENNLAYKWGEISMTATADNTEQFTPRPTVTSRFLGLTWTAVFDAWSRYDSVAVPVFLKKV